METKEINIMLHKNKDIKPNENFVITALISRRLAYPLAILFCKLKWTADAVTILGGSCWVLSAVSIILSGWLMHAGYIITGNNFLVAFLILVNLGYILDVADGSVARMSNTSSSAGYFLDYVFHLIFHPMFFCSIGIFLYLLTDSVIYLVIGIISICSGWGVSFSAKEHVLCDHIAKQKLDLSRFSDNECYKIFIDSPITQQTVEDKRSIKDISIALIKEILLFPGQYTFFSIIILIDLALNHYGQTNFILLQISFSTIAALTIIRVPFRIKREYRTLQFYDKINMR